MSAPLYFLPGVFRAQLLSGERFNRSLLAARGLEAIFGDVEDVRAEVAVNEITGCGPGGKSGTLLVPLAAGCEPPVRLGFLPDFQEWQSVGDQYWLGLDRQLPPTPAELRRAKPSIPGYGVTLGDGQRWSIPILRRPDGTTEFPSAFAWDAAGELKKQVRRAFRELWEEAGELVELFLANKLADEEHLSRVVEWCVRILGVNYRFDRALQSRLGTIGTDDYFWIVNYAIDYPTFLKLQDPEEKKTSEPTPKTCDGSPASGPATSSPAAQPVG